MVGSAASAARSAESNRWRSPASIRCVCSCRDGVAAWLTTLSTSSNPTRASGKLARQAWVTTTGRAWSAVVSSTINPTGFVSPQAVCALRILVRELMGECEALVFVDQATGDFAREPVADDAPPHVVAHGDRSKRARVVVEAGQVVDAGGLDHRFEVAFHAADAVVEPPRWSEVHSRIVA